MLQIFQLGLAGPSLFDSIMCIEVGGVLGFGRSSESKSLPWGGDPEENAPFMYESLPENCPLVATQCRVTKGDRKAWASFARAMHVANECIQPQGVIIYGGIELREKFIRNLPKGPEYIFLDAFMTKRRHRLKRS